MDAKCKKRKNLRVQNSIENNTKLLVWHPQLFQTQNNKCSKRSIQQQNRPTKKTRIRLQRFGIFQTKNHKLMQEVLKSQKSPNFITLSKNLSLTCLVQAIS